MHDVRNSRKKCLLGISSVQWVMHKWYSIRQYIITIYSALSYLEKTLYKCLLLMLLYIILCICVYLSRIYFLWHMHLFTSRKGCIHHENIVPLICEAIYNCCATRVTHIKMRVNYDTFLRSLMTWDLSACLRDFSMQNRAKLH